mmetsp:Transcript_29355/g.36286  ORF Transcript_29355/g.36286 Transcript_29355/m.36286 type:complete len:185 (+) Transcript_29355:3-557(+)
MIRPEMFCKCKIFGITAGWSHSIAVTSDGGVFAWGCGGEGRLGLFSFSDIHTPTRIDGVCNHVIVKAAAGFAHTCMMSSKGQIFVCGHGGYGQLGLGDVMLSKSILAGKLDYDNTKGGNNSESESSGLRIDLSTIPLSCNMSGDMDAFECDLQTPRRAPLKLKKSQVHVSHFVAYLSYTRSRRE